MPIFSFCVKIMIDLYGRRCWREKGTNNCCPEGLCESAWETMSPFVMGLAHGAENFYDGWMKNPRSVMISCNDGFRPVSFLLETMDEDAN